MKLFDELDPDAKAIMAVMAVVSMITIVFAAIFADWS